MATSSAVLSDLERLAEAMRQWVDELVQWERRLAQCGFHPAFAAATGVRLFRVTLASQQDRVSERAEAFRRADAEERLDAMSDRVHNLLRDAARNERGKRAKLLSALAMRGDRIYLRADSRHDGQLVEVMGDLVNAEHVVVLVPGMTNELANFDVQIRPRAVRIFNELQRQAPRTKVAVIAWQGYDSPDLSFTGLLQARASGRAKIGAEALAVDLATIRSLNPSAHMTVIGHSYGSVVLGQAMKRGLDRKGVADLIVLGSPGMDANNRRALQSPGINLWATKGTISMHVPLPVVVPLPPIEKITLDPISFAPAHGEDPSAIGFGAKRFSSEGAKTHGAYFDTGSEALKNIVRISLGRPEAVTR